MLNQRNGLWCIKYLHRAFCHRNSDTYRGGSREGPKEPCPSPQAEIWGAKLAFGRRPPNKLVKRRFLCCAFISIFEIKIRSFNFPVYLRHPWSPFCPIDVSYYQKCSQTMSKWNANESLISFGPKYLLKMLRYYHGEIVFATHTKGRWTFPNVTIPSLGAYRKRMGTPWTIYQL